MRTAVVETSDYSQLPEHKNPVARKHARLFDGGYGEEIFPGQPTFRKEEAQLYIDDREWRVDLDFDPPKYEAYLQHLFWDRESLRRLIIVSGPVGCGKSTLLDFYLRSYCPTDPETAEEWKKKLTIAVDVKGKYLDKITSLFFNYLLLVILRSAAKPVPSLRSRTSSKLAAGKNLMP